jgi:hypothetical protein
VVPSPHVSDRLPSGRSFFCQGVSPFAHVHNGVMPSDVRRQSSASVTSCFWAGSSRRHWWSSKQCLCDRCKRLAKRCGGCGIARQLSIAPSGAKVAGTMLCSIWRLGQDVLCSALDSPGHPHLSGRLFVLVQHQRWIFLNPPPTNRRAANCRPAGLPSYCLFDPWGPPSGLRLSGSLNVLGRLRANRPNTVRGSTPCCPFKRLTTGHSSNTGRQCQVGQPPTTSVPSEHAKLPREQRISNQLQKHPAT